MAVGREAVIDYEFLRWRQNETVVKELCVASAAAPESFRFKSPYKMADHSSIGNGIHWNEGLIEYRELHTVFNEAVAGFAHLYAHGVSKCTFLAGLTERPIHNLEDFKYRSPGSFNHDRWCTLHCHKFPTFACANKSARSIYDCLMYYLQNKNYVQCPPDMTRHTAEFVAAV